MGGSENSPEPLRGGGGKLRQGPRASILRTKRKSPVERKRKELMKTVKTPGQQLLLHQQVPARPPARHPQGHHHCCPHCREEETEAHAGGADPGSDPSRLAWSPRLMPPCPPEPQSHLGSPAGLHLRPDLAEGDRRGEDAAPAAVRPLPTHPPCPGRQRHTAADPPAPRERGPHSSQARFRRR